MTGCIRKRFFFFFNIVFVFIRLSNAKNISWYYTQNKCEDENRFKYELIQIHTLDSLKEQLYLNQFDAFLLNKWRN